MLVSNTLINCCYYLSFWASLIFCSWWAWIALQVSGVDRKTGTRNGWSSSSLSWSIPMLNLPCDLWLLEFEVDSAFWLKGEQAERKRKNITRSIEMLNTQHSKNTVSLRPDMASQSSEYTNQLELVQEAKNCFPFVRMINDSQSVSLGQDQGDLGIC